MKRIIPNKPITGTIKAPESKSYAHRYLIASYLSDTDSTVNLLNRSDDVMATKNGIAAILSVNEGEVATVECKASGSTLRFLLPIAAALGKDTKFMISHELAKRPTEPLYEALKEHGVAIKELEYEEEKCIRVRDKLFAGEFEIPGNVSSQFISGLMFALPLLERQSTIIVKGEFQSKSYVDMTAAVLAEAGIEIIPEDADDLEGKISAAYRIPGNQNYRLKGEKSIEGDWTNAAVWLAAGALSGPVTCTGLNMNSMQGDRKILEILKAFGADVTENEDGVTVRKSELKVANVDVSDNPDLVPEIGLLSYKAGGETKNINTEGLKFREFNRLKNVNSVLDALEEGQGKDKIEIDCMGDHRIAMMAAVAACIVDRPIEISGSECVSKSYPGFFDELENMM